MEANSNNISVKVYLKDTSYTKQNVLNTKLISTKSLVITFWIDMLFVTFKILIWCWMLIHKHAKPLLENRNKHKYYSCWGNDYWEVLT